MENAEALAHFESIATALVLPTDGGPPLSGVDASDQFLPDATDSDAQLRALNAAFLLGLGDPSPLRTEARKLLQRVARGSAASSSVATEAAVATLAAVATFYLESLDRIATEIASAAAPHRELRELAHWLRRHQRGDEQRGDDPRGDEQRAAAERVWQVFMPEGVGIQDDHDAQVRQLRDRRTVRITALNPSPLQHPARQILFTANVLLGLPAAGANELSEDLRARVAKVAREPQLFWYDPPIPIGTPPSSNEILYGLRALDDALEQERVRGNLPARQRATCVLSVSTTHAGLQPLAGGYVSDLLRAAGGMRNLEVYVFTESDTSQLIEQLLLPTAVAENPDAAALLQIFGVDGRYARHYNFLKAIAAIWQVVVDPQLRATFKIDLDQVFPQPELVEQAGGSALELLRTPLWGAIGRDSWDNEVELGMVAGALVNQTDIGAGLFTPDVRYPQQPPPLLPDEVLFTSRVPQALSTAAEMMARYDGLPAGREGAEAAQPPRLDGRTRCLQRIHVTGGTNGILLDALRRHRPFTPSFVGRAEDQAYLLSTFGGGPLGGGPLGGGHRRLGYAHAAGLIMRHDKHELIPEAIEAAGTGRLVGDYVRILIYSAYADAIGDRAEVKRAIDPFTGCFVSRLPVTLATLRLALRAATLYRDGGDDGGDDGSAGHESAGLASELVEVGCQQLGDAIAFTSGHPSQLRTTVARERIGWGLFYDTLDQLERALSAQTPQALEAQAAARAIVARCRVTGVTG